MRRGVNQPVGRHESVETSPADPAVVRDRARLDVEQLDAGETRDNAVPGGPRHMTPVMHNRVPVVRGDRDASLLLAGARIIAYVIAVDFGEIRAGTVRFPP
jgi:hypothetical protein